MKIFLRKISLSIIVLSLVLLFSSSAMAYGNNHSRLTYGYTPDRPDCPINSRYDSVSNSCKCYSGYVASGGECISEDEWCEDKYGLWAEYDTLSNSCECEGGYILSGNRCISGNTFCRNQYGLHASYDSLSDSCECDYGYKFNSDDQCVSNDEYCKGLYSYRAKYDSLEDKCVCKEGYVVSSDKTSCIDADTYCQNKFGFNSRYDSLSEKCKCSYGYILADSKCVDADNYCQNLYGSHSNYNSIKKECVCESGYKFKDNQCVTPEITDTHPLEVNYEEKVIIEGNYFGDDKYDELDLYVGRTKVNALDISQWQDEEIIFKVKDHLSSGRVTLEGNSVEAEGSYLDISNSDESTANYNPNVSIKTNQSSEDDSEPDNQSEENSNPEQSYEESQTNNSGQKSSDQQREEQKGTPLSFIKNSFNAMSKALSNLFK